MKDLSKKTGWNVQTALAGFVTFLPLAEILNQRNNVVNLCVPLSSSCSWLSILVVFFIWLIACWFGKMHDQSRTEMIDAGAALLPVLQRNPVQKFAWWVFLVQFLFNQITTNSCSSFALGQVDLAPGGATAALDLHGLNLMWVLWLFTVHTLKVTRIKIITSLQGKCFVIFLKPKSLKSKTMLGVLCATPILETGVLMMD